MDFTGLKCWGTGDQGQLGLGDGNHSGDMGGEMGDYLPFVNVGSGLEVIEVYTGKQWTTCLLTDNQIKNWGEMDVGQLGYGDSTYNRGRLQGSMGNNLPFMNIGEDFIPIHIFAGDNHGCAISIVLFYLILFLFFNPFYQ